MLIDRKSYDGFRIKKVIACYTKNKQKPKITQFKISNIVTKEKGHSKKLHKNTKNKQHQLETNIVPSVPNEHRRKFDRLKRTLTQRFNLHYFSHL